MKHLFAEWAVVDGQLRQAKHILLFSDFDGTLAPIVEQPEFAHLSESVRDILRALSRQSRFTVGIISGRALKDLKSRVGITGILYAGNHGLEIEGPGLSFIHPFAEELRPVLHLLSQVLTKALKPLTGVFVEDKGLSLSIHYRQTGKTEEKECESTFERVVHVPRVLNKIRITSGKKVYEVRPCVTWDKGKAISMLLAKYNKVDDWTTVPIFLGDDLTDEDGFKVIHKHNGISIFIGEPQPGSVARYFLHSTSEVEEFLRLISKKDKRVGS